MRAALIAIGMLVGAAVVRPAALADETLIVWNAPLLRGVSLGRAYVAADVTWIGLAQAIGSRVQEAAGFPTVLDQVDVITTLDPEFNLAYQFGVIVVVTDTKRAEKMDRLLARGRREFPKDFEFPRMQGFLAQFGKLDFAAAARFYRDAAALGGPPYLEKLAKRLENSELRCRQVRDELAALARSAEAREEQRLLLTRTSAILENCEKTRLESAAARFRLMNNNQTPSVDDLIGPDFDAPLHPPGRCWNLEQGVRAKLEPCP
jgi:hypothetical protein